MKEKKELRKVLKMKEVVIQALFVFVGNGYGQHAAAEWKE